MSEWTVLGDAETVKALFQLKKAGREYRQDMTADNARQAAKQFSKAAMTAAEDEKSYAEIMRTAAGGVLDEAAARLDMAKLAELGADDEFYALFSAEAAKRFQEYLKERAKNAAEIHRAEHRAGMGGAAAKEAKAAEEEPVVGELRAEIAGAIGKDKTLSDEEKAARVQALAAAKEIKVQVKGAKCKLTFGDFAAETMLARDGVQMPGKFSRYAALSAETVKTLKNGKYATAAGKNAKNAKAAEAKAAKKAAEQAKKYDDLLKRRNDLHNQEAEKIAELAQGADGEKVFADILGGGRLAAACVDSGQAEEAFVQAAAKGAMDNRRVWALFRDSNSDDCYNTSSFYEKCLQNVVTGHNLDAGAAAVALWEAYNGGCRGEDLKKRAILQAQQTAGMTLPYEEAKKLLQQEVYKMGMAVRHGELFDENKFKFMNEVLETDGYRITFEEVPVVQKSGKGAKALSDEILNDMRRADGIKATKNKEIALMYRLGALLRGKPKADLTNIGASKQTEELYDTFMRVFYNAEPRRSGGLYDKTYEAQWKAFVQNDGNLQKAVTVCDYFRGEAAKAGDKNGEKLTRWIENMERGNYIEPGNPLISSSAHHVFYRRFGGVAENPAAQLNAADNVTPVISMHPADIDAHKDEEHKFDMKEVYLFKRDGVVLNGTFNAVREGDVLLMPVVLKQRADGQFRRLMEPDTLLASADMAIKEPVVPNRSNGVAERSVRTLIRDTSAYSSGGKDGRA